MVNKKTQEYIDLIDETIHLEGTYNEDTEEYRQSQIRIFNFREIKRILDKKPDEELIQNTYDEIYTHVTYDIDMRISIDEDEIKSIIRKLLQDSK